MGEKEKIREKTALVEELHLGFEMELKYVDLVIEEIKETAVRAEQQKGQSEKLIG